VVLSMVKKAEMRKMRSPPPGRAPGGSTTITPLSCPSSPKRAKTGPWLVRPE
jgi:hypothetical protein